MTVEKGLMPGGRVVSIDALRGFDMFWIIGGGAVFNRLFDYIDTGWSRALALQLQHVDWHGCRFEDIIFPLFLFLIGASLPFSISKRLERGESRGGLYRHIVKRTVILYVLGLAYYGLFNLDLANQRYVGVLPRLAVCYFFASMIVMNFKIRGQAVWAGGILLFYWAIMYLVPVPGYGAGVITPEGNLSAWVDMTFLPGRLNHFGDYLYGDTTGLLGNVPATTSALLGTLAAHWLRRDTVAGSKKAPWLAFAGIASILVALLWGLVFPINKHIWTSSFVMYAGGWCLLLMALFYWIIDVKGWKTWAFPFIVIGMNPLTVYMAQRFVNFGYTAEFFLGGIAALTGGFGPVILAAGGLTVKWLLLYFLYRQRIFIKV